jgi:hypothetical protein
VSPAEPTEAMLDAPRIFIMFCETPGRTFADARKFVEDCGDSIEHWPEWAKSAQGHITKSAFASIVWHLMEAAR